MKKTWKIDIDCPNCAAKVERALQKLPGADNVAVNYVQKKITLEAADDRFEEVRKAAYAKMKEIEPDAEIFFDEAPAKPQGNIKQSWKLDIDCPNCAAKVERALQKLPGVVSVSVNYVQKKITLEAADDRFEEVRKAAYAKMKEIEPDAEIFFDEAEQPSGTVCPCGGHHHEDDDEDEHEHHQHHHDSECGCGHEHHHHDDNDHDEREHHEHSHEHGHEHGGANKGKKLMIRVATAVVLLALGLVSKTNLGETHWATIVVFIAAYLVAGYDVLWRAICNIRHGEVFDENFLMTVASVGAMCVAEYAEGVAVMVLYQIGEYFQDKAVDKSRESITKLMDIRPDYANLVEGNDSRRVSPERVRVGDIILVKPGEKIPLDGVVIEGNSSLNTTALTGESLPRDVKEGDQVLSGCVNLSGVLKVKVTVGYGESTVAKILALVESSGDAKAKTERFITKFSRIYTPAVCFFALALAIIPSLFDGNWTKWIYTALTFLVISCPCALVISVPLTFFSGIGGASKKGILIKGATYLETLAGLDTVVFDKTGTLTKGTFSVTGVHPAKGVTKDELLDVAAHAEAFSDHPIAISIKEALGRAVDMNRVSDASEAAGHGVQAKVDGQQVYAGNARLMESIGVKAAEPAEIGTVVHVARGGQYLGALVISDVIKENRASAMEVRGCEAAGHADRRPQGSRGGHRQEGRPDRLPRGAAAGGQSKRARRLAGRRPHRGVHGRWYQRCACAAPRGYRHCDGRRRRGCRNRGGGYCSDGRRSGEDCAGCPPRAPDDADCASKYHFCSCGETAGDGAGYLRLCEHVAGGLCGCRRGNAGDSQCHARDENETIMEETACSAANEMRDAPLPAENVRETEIFF